MRYCVDISSTGYWHKDTNILAHQYSEELSCWIVKFLSKQNQQNEPLYDLGCGLGLYLKKLKENNFSNLTGYEGDPHSLKQFDNIKKQDLTKIIKDDLPKGNVISLEVGEHIPFIYMENFLDNIDKLCNNFLIISWAIKTQKGHGHVNCLNNDEILPILCKRNYILLHSETIQVRNIISENCKYFKKTLFILKKEKIRMSKTICKDFHCKIIESLNKKEILS